MKRTFIFATAAAAVGLALASAPATLQAQEPTANVVASAEAYGLQEWTRGVRAAGYEERLGEGTFTIFAAEDAAYQQVPAATRETWQTDPAAQRAAVGHTIVEGRLTLDELRQREYVTTIDGQRIPVRVEGDRVMVGEANIQEGDLAAGPGLIHRVDRVLLPPPTAPAMEQPAVQQPGVQPPAVQDPPAVRDPLVDQPVRERVRKD